MSKSVTHLFDQFHPKNYQLAFAVDKDAMTFRGTVTITGRKVGRPSKRLTFHQKALRITEASIVLHQKQGQQTIAVDRINNQSSYDEVRLHTNQQLFPGEYTVTMAFEGKLTRPMHGIYPCYYDHEGTEKFLLATQFEPHFAREAFPCIDEPEAKATFDLTLDVPAGEHALSNMPISKETKLENGGQRVTFGTTPIMSTYLLAFAMGEIQSVEATASDGTIIRTWSTIAQPKSYLEYANNEAVKILEFFTEYFQTPFPLEKCDQIALPDFEAGAMENWGLITYREIALLTDPDNRSQSSEQYISMVVAHELSHQWFGNLVTMKWWDDLWLNESFASLMEHVALNALHPDWFQWEQYTASDVIACSSRDIYTDVQSVQVTVKHPDEITTLFDPAIVYAKGGRLLKMLHDYIGEDAFRAALKEYFSKHAYKNTRGADLWEAMSAASHKDIGAFMNPWLNQSGMPLLTVVHGPGVFELSQERFVLDKQDDKQLWPIPLLTDQKLDDTLLETKTATIKRPSKQPTIFNHNGSGHMVVHYADKEARRYMVDAFTKQIMLAEARINHLNDMLLLSRRGDASLVEALEVVLAAQDEPREAVWSIMARIIGTAMHLTEGDEDTDIRIKTARRLLGRKQYERLGWDDRENDSPNDIGLRSTILSLMIASKDKDAIDEALRRYKAADNVIDLPAEQRAMIIGAAVRAGIADADDLMKEYRTTANADLQLSLCLALTSVKDPKVAAHIIDKALGTDGFVRPQDIFRWFAYLMRNRYTRELTWQWLIDSWERLEELFGDSKSFEYFVVYSAAVINTEDWQMKFLEFYEPKSEVVALRRNIAIARSEIQARVDWRNREEAKLKAFFADYN